MTSRQLVFCGLTYYWRTNLAVVLGVATAVAVLAGALVVGDSVRGSLRDLVLQRIGRTDRVLVSSGFFRDALADNLRADPAFASSFDEVCPIVAVEGLVSDPASGRRASRVQVYGIDDRFWHFHGRTGGRGPEGREALVSQTLASDLGVAAGAAVLVRVERPSAIPRESLHGRKDEAGRALRLTVRAIVSPEDLGEFSLRPQQGAVRAVFVPLQRLQQDLGLQGRVNTLLVADHVARPFQDHDRGTALRQAQDTPSTSSGERAAQLEALIRRRFALADVGLSIRSVGGGTHIAVESDAGLLDAARANAVDATAARTGMKTQPVLTYLANSIRSGDREIPYSLVTAIDLRTIAPVVVRPFKGRDRGAESPALQEAALPPIVLNEWAARDLAVKVGDPLTLEYSLWEDPGRLVTRTADFQIAAIVPINGAAADRDYAPVYPGITDASTFGDWDPPFPIDLRRVRPIDEEYWTRYRTTPKAFVPLEVGHQLWRSRYGDRTSVRVDPGGGVPATEALDRFAARLRETIDPIAMGLSVRDVRGEGIAAARGATDFGEYFAYFSAFLVASAVLLAALFFRLAVEQRAREVGLLRAVGFSPRRVRRLFTAEGIALALAGSVLGVAGAVAYASVMMLGLRTWWVGAVATTSLTLHVSPWSLLAGAAGAVEPAFICIWWTLRELGRLSERSLLSGRLDVARPFQGRDRGAESPALQTSPPPRVTALAFVAGGLAALGIAMIAASAAGAIDRTGAFFGAGTSLLVACLCVATVRLRRPPRSVVGGHGWRAIARLGFRNAADRPGRSVLAIGVIASATFILIAVDAFRKDASPTMDRHSGAGGYPLLVNLLMPITSDPNSRDGRDALGLSAFDDIAIEPFRVRPGDDTSCLNLYEVGNPRILGARTSFLAAGRFAFQRSIAATDAERANPWLLLDREVDAGNEGAASVVPVIADANSMTYVLHKTLGDDLVIDAGGKAVRLRFVAALSDSIFQAELLMSEANFMKLFPQQQGHQFLLMDAPADRAAAVATAIEKGAGDLGADAMSTAERLAAFHAVENTYLSTFRTLGGLGLLVGTMGLAAVLLRNVLERRRELALLGAIGYRRGHIFAIIVSEHALLLAWGLAAGAICAVVAITPAVVERGGTLPAAGSAGLLLLAVFAAGLVSSVIATRAALSAPLLDALRSE
jgi:ABC-type lipoprotein release transport system permease subunit